MEEEKDEKNENSNPANSEPKKFSPKDAKKFFRSILDTNLLLRCCFA
jgi:hypothetical protein